MDLTADLVAPKLPTASEMKPTDIGSPGSNQRTCRRPDEPGRSHSPDMVSARGGANVSEAAGPIPAERFDGRVQLRAPIGAEQLAAIPAKRGVVLMTANQAKPIVLMTAADVRARVHNRLTNPDADERRKLPNLHEIARAVWWKRTSWHFETDLTFLELARAIWAKGYESLLAFKPAWFIHVNAQEEYPRFVRTREVFSRPGRHVGPFESARSAQALIAAIQDGFELCRDYPCLRRSPHGQPCAYGQMGRCLQPCDGTISMDAYRQAMSRAAAVAAGDRRAVLDELTCRMRQAAEKLDFELAARLKARLECLAELDKPAYAHVAPAEHFRFVLIQPGPSSHQAKTFLVDRGAVAAGPLLDYPLQDDQLARAAARMAAHVSAEHPAEARDRWTIGLVARYLFSAEARRGLILRWDPAMTAANLAEAIESMKAPLRLRQPKQRGRKKDDSGSKAPADKAYNDRARGEK